MAELSCEGDVAKRANDEEGEYWSEKIGLALVSFSVH